MPSYIPHLIIPDFDYIHFEKTALANPHSLYRMNLIQGQLEIMPPSPVHTETDEREFDIIGQLYTWVFANRNLVGKASASQGCYTLPNTIDDPKPTILGPDASVVLSARWNTLSNADRRRAFPPVAPNFVVELRLQSQSPQDFHRKMELWINGGVEEGIAIDRYANLPEVRIYTLNPDTNSVVWQPLMNPAQVPSQVLAGFVLNMRNIY
ncbi:Uma2 family endonuclease [Gigaspora margarita]|uniref:Uma2 family endonuclease n=1 Tax=Gigaspora margarita TaxID=4874 RepID=A0A8H3XDK9_GIGMA|nr:Uma2 family endonuclease [Gigaspora margarita]